MLIFAAVSLTIGILALLNKSIFGGSQHLVVGIFMIGEAALDLVTYFLLNNGMKKQNELKEMPATAPETAAEPNTLPEGTEATSEENVSAETVPAEPRETTEQEETPKADTEIPEQVPEKEE